MVSRDQRDPCISAPKVRKQEIRFWQELTLNILARDNL